MQMHMSCKKREFSSLPRQDRSVRRAALPPLTATVIVAPNAKPVFDFISG
jgi:hypothetical protein